jgi:hypothetical protein
MLDDKSISVVFEALVNPNAISAANLKIIENLSRDYPYFIPVRYLKASESYKKERYSQTFWSTIKGYEGNWIIFNEFLHGTNNGAVAGQNSQSARVVIPESNAEKIANIVNELTPTSEIPVAPKPQESKVSNKFSFLTIPVVEDAIPETKVIPESASIINEVEQVQKFDKQNYVDADIEDIFDTSSPEPELPKQPSRPLKVPMPETVFKVPVEIKPQPIPVVQPEPIPVVQPDEPKKTQSSNPDDSDKLLDELFSSFTSSDYFVKEGIKIPTDMPEDLSSLDSKIRKDTAEQPQNEDRWLMVLMSFEEWLLHYRNKSQEISEEQENRKVFRSMVQNSGEAKPVVPTETPISVPEHEEDNSDTEIWSESLAQIYLQQGKHDLAIDMYLKLSLKNPEKSAYFAKKIENIFKVK